MLLEAELFCRNNEYVTFWIEGVHLDAELPHENSVKNTVAMWKHCTVWLRKPKSFFSDYEYRICRFFNWRRMKWLLMKSCLGTVRKQGWNYGCNVKILCGSERRTFLSDEYWYWMCHVIISHQNDLISVKKYLFRFITSPMGNKITIVLTHRKKFPEMGSYCHEE